MDHVRYTRAPACIPSTYTNNIGSVASDANNKQLLDPPAAPLASIDRTPQVARRRANACVCVVSGGIEIKAKAKASKQRCFRHYCRPSRPAALVSY